jgi:hypothetical protein
MEQIPALLTVSSESDPLTFQGSLVASEFAIRREVISSWQKIGQSLEQLRSGSLNARAGGILLSKASARFAYCTELLERLSDPSDLTKDGEELAKVLLWGTHGEYDYLLVGLCAARIYAMTGKVREALDTCESVLTAIGEWEKRSDQLSLFQLDICKLVRARVGILKKRFK